MGLHKTPNIFKILQMLPHPYSIFNKTHLIAIQMGLKYAKVNPISFTIPHSIVWTIQTTTIAKDMCSIIPLYTRVIPTMRVLISFHESTIINIILDTMVNVEGRKLIENCYQKSLTTNCYQKLLLEIINQNCYRKPLLETNTRNHYWKVHKIAIGNHYWKLLLQNIIGKYTENHYQKLHIGFQSVYF
jgi:hypothetical protein